MSDKMRDGFESWCLAKGYTLRQAQTNCGIIIEGDYGHPTVQIAWQAWQASRAAPVVELPDSWILGENGDDIDALSTVDVKTSLDNAVISYKLPHHKP